MAHAYAFNTATDCSELHSAETGLYAHRTLTRNTCQPTATAIICPGKTRVRLESQ